MFFRQRNRKKKPKKLDSRRSQLHFGAVFFYVLPRGERMMGTASGQRWRAFPPFHPLQPTTPPH